ncbi:PGF-pre-PGF domain-containing protein [Halobium salinum]|uniref:PGF-pre-PGF domain-containing protein n=1 Tax=Halobium salinum TaxID=1364940 RepID=A0ABD5P7A7_9EURY|nr:PGF-pre-PGF domain-containing protein [Halobium salinum]
MVMFSGTGRSGGRRRAVFVVVAAVLVSSSLVGAAVPTGVSDERAALSGGVDGPTSANQGTENASAAKRGPTKGNGGEKNGDGKNGNAGKNRQGSGDAGDEQVRDGDGETGATEGVEGVNAEKNGNGNTNAKNGNANAENGNASENDKRGNEARGRGKGTAASAGFGPESDGNGNGEGVDERSERAKGGVTDEDDSRNRTERGKAAVSRTGRTGGPGEGVGADFRVRNVSAGETVVLNVSGRPEQPRSKAQAGNDRAAGSGTAADRGVGRDGVGDRATSAGDGPAVSVDSLAPTVTRDGAYTMNVTSSDTSPSNAPDFVPGDGAESVGHIRVNHSVPDSEIENVTFRFRVSKDRLDSMAVASEDLTLYRYHDAEWNALETSVVEVTETHVRYRAESPGLSDFVTGVKRPEFEVDEGSLDVEVTDEDDRVTATALVSNVGGADGTYTAELALDGEVVAREPVTVAAGGTRRVELTYEPSDAGTFDASLSGVPAGRVSVQPASTPTARRTLTTVATNLSATVFPGLQFGGLSLALVGIGLHAIRRRREF